MFLLLAAVAFAAVPLDTLVPTSGVGVEAIVDGDPKTGWTPLGDGRDEGVLLRFASPVTLRAVAVQPCSGGEWTVFVNGRESAPSFGKAVAVSSLYLRSTSQKACLAEVILQGSDGPVKVTPPRRLAGSITASSTQSPLDAYHPAYLLDGRTDFGWVEGAPGTGEGQSVTVQFATPVTLTGFQLWNGYQRSADHLAKNARAAQIEVVGDGGVLGSFAVADTMGPQRFGFPAPVTTTRFTLRIVAAKKGTRWEDLVLSELRFEDAQGPFLVATRDEAERSAALKQEIAGTPLEGIVDVQLHDACAGSSEGSSKVKFRSNHTFVAWIDLVEGAEETHEVFDGAWVLQGTAGAWSSVQLYGRRHRVDVTDAMYASRKTTTTERVSGGEVRVAKLRGLGSADLSTLGKLGVLDAGGAFLACDYDGVAVGDLVPQAVVLTGPALQGGYAP